MDNNEIKLTHGGLCEGIGGFSLGAKRAGIRTVWFSENNNYKQNILSQHFPETKLYGNIFKIKTPEKVDIISAGFPCTDTSIAGAGKGLFGDNSGLWVEVFRIIVETMPGYIVLENSPQLCKKGLEYILYDLSRIGYDAEWKCLQANQFGHRHKRKRFFIIAYPMRRRTLSYACIFRSIPEVLPGIKQRDWTGQAYLPSLLKRFNRHSDTLSFRTNTRFSEGLDKAALHAIGDSLNVDIAQYLFECIKIHATL